MPEAMRHRAPDAGPREIRTVYGLKARTSRVTGFGYDAVDDFVFDGDMVAYVRAGTADAKYLLVFGQRRGLPDFRGEGRIRVRPLDRDEQKRVRALFEKEKREPTGLFRSMAETIYFW